MVLLRLAILCVQHTPAIWGHTCHHQVDIGVNRVFFHDALNLVLDVVQALVNLCKSMIFHFIAHTGWEVKMLVGRLCVSNRAWGRFVHKVLLIRVDLDTANILRSLCAAHRVYSTLVRRWSITVQWNLHRQILRHVRIIPLIISRLLRIFYLILRQILPQLLPSIRLKQSLLLIGSLISPLRYHFKFFDIMRRIHWFHPLNLYRRWKHFSITVDTSCAIFLFLWASFRTWEQFEIRCVRDLLIFCHRLPLA